jgi:hypothetical protein
MLRPGRRDPKDGMTQAHKVKKKVHCTKGSRGKVSGWLIQHSTRLAGLGLRNAAALGRITR